MLAGLCSIGKHEMLWYYGNCSTLHTVELDQTELNRINYNSSLAAADVYMIFSAEIQNLSHNSA